MIQTGKLYIDDIDAYDEYGVFVEKGGYRQIVQEAPFKKVEVTEWPELDGVEADLVSVRLDAYQVQVPFCIINVSFAQELFLLLSDGAVHQFAFAEVGKSMSLRLVSNGTFSSLYRLGRLTLTFAVDQPETTKDTDPYGLGESEVSQRGYLIDDIDLSQFGCWVLKGSDDDIRRSPNVRQNLRYEAKNMQGALYDGLEAHFRAKDVNLRLLIDAPSLDDFRDRWNSLFTVLFSSGSRKFHFSKLNSDYACFYKNNSVARFEILSSGRVWCEFSVILTFTDWLPYTQWLLLAAEGSELVLTEDEESNIKVRLR